MKFTIDKDYEADATDLRHAILMWAQWRDQGDEIRASDADIFEARDESGVVTEFRLTRWVNVSYQIEVFGADGVAVPLPDPAAPTAPDTAYRPGLPDMEQVRAHEARGGWWMGRIEKRPQRWPDALRFVNMIATGKIIQYAEGNDGHFFAGPTLTNPLGDWDDEAFLARYAWRPCLPDGTPCPWGDL